MRPGLFVLAMAVFLCALVACDTSAPSATPTRRTTAIPVALPSSTPVPIPMPRFTPTLRETQTPPATLSPLIGAFGKTQAAQKYRVAMTLEVKSLGVPTFLLKLTGEVNGSDAHTTYQIGGEQVELITARGQFFVKGARGLGLPSAVKWYSLAPDLADAAQPPFAPLEVLHDFVVQTARVTFQSAARAPLDGQNCAVWRAVPQSPAETGIGDLLGAGHANSAFSALEQAEIKVWLCDDGAAHQVSVDIVAHNANKPTDKGTAKWLLHLWDIDSAAIQIDAPANAEPFRLVEPTR